MLALGCALAAAGQAQAPHSHGAPAATASSQLYEGQVRRVNTEMKRVTIAHGPLTGFDMPAMTMAFSVKDPAQLAKVKEGDKVKFALEKSGENLVVTRIEAVK
jgi:Cu/Ag efflux protein CusF